MSRCQRERRRFDSCLPHHLGSFINKELEKAEVPDTIICYNEGEKCSVCHEGPVEIIHFGPLADKDRNRMCLKCWKEKSKAGITQ